MFKEFNYVEYDSKDSSRFTNSLDEEKKIYLSYA